MSNTSGRIETVTLYEEYRLIEKDDDEINLAWRAADAILQFPRNCQPSADCSVCDREPVARQKIGFLLYPGAGCMTLEGLCLAVSFVLKFLIEVILIGVHLLLFFLAFVFGSFCTFCFHMLMYMFDDKCVLFPKLLSLKEMKKSQTVPGSPNKLLYDFISDDLESLPVDFVSTHWVEKSTCYLPTYVPLLSGICGLIWTTMFLMCSSGSRTLTGLQRPWRILPTVFVFSLAMGGLSIYTSFVTQAGLDELCIKLGELTGTNTCTYTINVATLAYERRIRGVYQATRLAIMSAWLHTFCWIGAALTAMLRVILVVDFRLVKVKVDLQGNIEKMLERHEKHIRTDEFSNKDDSLRQTSATSVKVRFVNKGFGTEPPKTEPELVTSTTDSKETVYFVSKHSPYTSEMSLVPEEDRKLTIRSASVKVLKKHRFIVEILHDIIDLIGTKERPRQHVSMIKSEINLMRQQGQQNIRSIIWSPSSSGSDLSVINHEEAEQLAKDFRRQLERKITIHNFKLMTPSTLTPGSVTRIESEQTPPGHKSNLKHRGVQTEEAKKATTSQRVQISTPTSSQVTIQTLKALEEQSWRRSIAESTITVVTPETKASPPTIPVLSLETEASPPTITVVTPETKASPPTTTVVTPETKASPPTITVITPETKSNQSTITVLSPETKASPPSITVVTPEPKASPSTITIVTPETKASQQMAQEGKKPGYSSYLLSWMDNENVLSVPVSPPPSGDSQQPRKVEDSSKKEYKQASLQDAEQPPKVKETSLDAPKKEREQGFTIRDDQEPGPSRTEEEQDDSKNSQKYPKKTDKKEKQD